MTDLADPLTGEEDWIEKHEDTLSFCIQDENFIKQCIRVSLENENKFWIFFDMLDELIVLDNIIIIKDQVESLKFVYVETLLALIEVANLSILYEILKQIENRTKENVRNLSNRHIHHRQ